MALVTGAASGIGKAIARRLASEGAVLVTDGQDTAGTQVAKDIGDGGRGVYRHLDVTSPPEWEGAVAAAVEEFGRLDILLNNAGLGDLAAIEDTALEDWNTTIGIVQTGLELYIDGGYTASQCLRRPGLAPDRRCAAATIGGFPAVWHVPPPSQRGRAGAATAAVRGDLDTVACAALAGAPWSARCPGKA